ncbi:MAG: PaaI family thioesterase [Thermodesulfobacteriota bacterium]|nr:PaaI family thioesterase [Thermodesulfobacteriota bacterium]
MEYRLDRKADNKSEKNARSTGPHVFEMERWISCAPFEKFLHMTILDASNGQATLTMPFHIEFAQGAGFMHGGALVSLADTSVVMAIKSILQPQTHFATIAMEAKFLYPVKQGNVTARAKVIKREGRTLYGQATVFNDAEKPVLEFTSTFKVAKDSAIKNITFQDNP